jgi:tetratricopeptide (TPR) repeat protein
MNSKWHTEKTELQVYRILDEDPLPKFFRYYPYVGLNNFNDKPEPVVYETIVVENEYLKMRIIPSLGARVHDLYDKINNAHVFHYNEVLRPVIGLREAWTSDGIEFNCLDRPEHTPDNFSPVDWKVKEWEDGSITVYIGNVILFNNIYYLVGLTLRPGRAFLETTIKTFNNDPLRAKYYFWTNAAVPVTEGSRVFIPGKHTVDDTFPVTREGLDVSWYKNCMFGVDAFIIDCEEDFFGYYDYNTNYGLVQHANHFKVPGKKRFTWGTSEYGLLWAPILSDRGIPYIELQSGKYRTQSIVGFVDPHYFDEWEEWWYPIAKINGISYANKDAVIYVDAKPGDKAFRIMIGVYVTKDFPNAKIKIHLGAEVVEEEFDLTPGNPFVKELRSKDKRVKVEVIDENSNEIIAWDCRDYRTRIDESVYRRPSEFSIDAEKQKTAEELWVDGELEERMGNTLLAELKYKQALKVDSNFSKALCSLAILYYRKGKYGEATKLLEEALKRNLDYGIYYYLGLCHLKLGDEFSSEIEFWEARRSMRFFSPSSYGISIIKMRNKEYGKAEEVLREVAEKDTMDFRCLFLLAAALRKQGKIEEALRTVHRALEVFPLYYPLLSELMLCSEKEGSPEFERVVLAREHKLLEVAVEYIRANLYDDAERILNAGILKGLDGPMVHYYLGFVYGKLQQVDEMKKHYRIGDSKNPDYVFPYRIEEEEILRSVITITASPKARYYLGNLLFHFGRFDEAIKEWRIAEQNGLKHPVLHRNLGFAYYKLYRDYERAMKEYEEAIAMDPLNYRLYLEYYEVCSMARLFEKAIEALEKISGRVKKESVLAALSVAYVNDGKCDEALKILEENTFTPAEGYYGYWELFVEAYVRRGIENLKNEKYEEALKCFLKALTYPKNLGVGAPYAPHRHEAKQRYWAGQCYFLMGEKKKAREMWRSILIQKFFNIDEVYYKGLALRMLGRKKEALKLFKGELKEALEKEGRIISIKRKISEEYFNALNYDRKLVEARCRKIIAYLGLRRNREAMKELRKVLRITSRGIFVERMSKSWPVYVSIRIDTY